LTDCLKAVGQILHHFGFRGVIEEKLIADIVGMGGVLIQKRKEIDVSLPDLARMRVLLRESGILS
jgi:hypothetical protein